MSALLAVLLVGATLADEPAYFHPDSIAQQSALFARGAEASGRAFEKAQQKLDAGSAKLTALDQCAALAGSESFTEYAEGLRKSSAGQFLQVQAFVGVLTQDFGDTFGAALDRAAAQLEGYELVECQASGVQAMMGKSQCKGEDLNSQLAASLDQDEQLKADLEEILSLEWPEYSIEGSQQPAIELTGSTNLIYLEDLAAGLLKPRIDSLDDKIADRLDEVEALKESGEQADLDQALEQGKIIRAIYEQDMNAMGGMLLDQIKALAPKMEKKGLPTELAVCPNPRSLGGCAGEDVSEQAIQAMTSNKKFMKAFGG